MGLRLLNKVALVTGASRDIGRAIAELFYQEGAFVILSDIRDEDGQKAANALGEKASYLHLDVKNEDEWIKVTDEIIKKFGHLDILVNNAGILGLTKELGLQNPEDCSLDTWHKIHSVNSDGTFLGCKHAIRVMKKNNTGSIINISSRSGLVGVPHAAAYASSKASIRNHTKSVALHCAEKNYNIRCNVIHPASILTHLLSHVLGTGAEREEKIKKLSLEIPLRRMGTPQDVAHAVLYFASDESAYVTGSELIVDGGILAGTNATPTSISSEDNPIEVI